LKTPRSLHTRLPEIFLRCHEAGNRPLSLRARNSLAVLVRTVFGAAKDAKNKKAEGGLYDGNAIRSHAPESRLRTQNLRFEGSCSKKLTSRSLGEVGCGFVSPPGNSFLRDLLPVFDHDWRNFVDAALALTAARIACRALERFFLELRIFHY